MKQITNQIMNLDRSKLFFISLKKAIHMQESLFDLFFNLLVKSEQKCQLHPQNILYAIPNEDDKHSPLYVHTYSLTEFSSYKSYPSRAFLEEYLSTLILNQSPSLSSLSLFLSSEKQTFSVSDLITRLHQDHPDVVQRIQTYSSDQLLDGCIHFLKTQLQQKSESNHPLTRLYSPVTLYANKEGGAQLTFKQNQVYYEEVNMTNAPNTTIAFDTNQDLKTFLLRRHYLYEHDGLLGGVVMTQIQHDLQNQTPPFHTIRQYLDAYSK